MSWKRRVQAGLASVVVVAASMPGAATSKGITVDDACTIVSRRLVEKAFGRPATAGTPSADKLGCIYGVGTDPGQPPGGALTATQLFPNFYVRENTALAALEDRHAIDTLSEHQLVDVFHVGRSAYLDETTGDLVVLATKRYAFVLRWEPAPAGARIDASDLRKLKALARAAVARAPR